MNLKRKATIIVVLGCLCIGVFNAEAQPPSYTVNNTHAHNDYDHSIPFYTAYYAGFGSIEADVIFINNQLYVAHDTADVKTHRTLQSLYLDPLRTMIVSNKGSVYKDAGKTLLLLIDLKSTAAPTLDKLLQVLQAYPEITTAASLKIVITGNQPPVSSFTTYPAFIHFDGSLKKTYTTAELNKVALFSDNFKTYTRWNGKGIPVEADRKKLEQAVKAAHTFNKPIRFWAAPDLPNAWYQLMRLGADYLNTDKIPEIVAFLNNLPANSFTATTQQAVYTPAFTHDQKNVPVKNVILLIGDGMGLAHIYAAYTANKGQLNMLNIRSMGMSKTDAADNYITDSGGGGTAMATGNKTNNRFIGVAPNGSALPQLPTLFKKQKKSSAVITTGDVTDATPAAFYAFNTERDSSYAIAKNFAASSVDVLIGAGRQHFEKPADNLVNSLRNNKVNVQFAVSDPIKPAGRTIVLDEQAALPAAGGRGNFLVTGMQQSLQYLEKNKNGFLLVAEGAKIDAGGHLNNMATVVTELLDFDQAVGQAMRYADTHTGTLVIVTADHETGGLTLLDGDLKTGYVSGHFSTEDHTGISVPVFAYGPRSNVFSGFYNNTQIFHKILAVLK